MPQVVTFEDYTPPQREDGNPWTQARIDEAATSTGTWTTIDTVDLDPIDTDPSNPAAQSFTTEAGTGDGLWYRVVFFDGDGDASAPTDPVQNAPATTTAFATARDLAYRLGLTFDDEERDRADALLEAASDVIRDETGLALTLATSTYTRPGTTDARIPLPERPVVSVASVALNGVAIDGWYVSGNEIVREGWLNSALFDRLILSTGGFWGFERDTLTIVYTHGYADPSGVVKQTCLEMCVRVWVNPGSVVQAGDGSEDTTFAPYADPPRGLMLTKSELGAIRRKLGMRGRSLTIGGG